MPKGDNPNSRANLKAGRQFNEEIARKAAKKSGEKRSAKRKLMEETNRELIEEVFTEESRKAVLAKIQELALEGNPEMMKLFAKITGMDKTTLEISKAQKDITKTEKETKRIESDTKRIDMETELLKQKLATPEDTADDGFVDAIEGRIADVWGGDDEQ